MYGIYIPKKVTVTELITMRGLGIFLTAVEKQLSGIIIVDKKGAFL